MTKRLKGLLGIWLTVIMLFGIVAAPVQVGAIPSHEGDVMVCLSNITNEPSGYVDPTDIFTPSSGEKFIDTVGLSDGLSQNFTGEIVGFEVWTYYEGGGYYLNEMVAEYDKDWVITQDEINTYDMYDASYDYIILPVTAFYTIPVYVGGVKLERDVYYVNSDGTVKSDGADSTNYNAYLTRENNNWTLKINNLNVRGKTGFTANWYGAVSGWCSAPESAGIAADSDIIINVNGENSVNGVDNPEDNYDDSSDTIGIYGHNANITFTGSGSLNVATDADSGKTAGIITNRNLVFDGPEISATAGNNGNESYGIYVNGSNYIRSGSVKAIGSRADKSVGIYSYDNMYVTDGMLEAQADSDASDKNAIRNSSLLCFSDGSQTNGNWYKWKTAKDGEWNISSDENQYVPSSGEVYVLIAGTGYTEPGDEDGGDDDTPTPPIIPSSSGGTIRYAVYFNTGEDDELTKTYVTRNSKLKEPEDPVKKDYTFGGWYTEKEFENLYDFELPVKEKFTLYAKWIGNDESPVPSDSDNSLTDNGSSDVGINCPSAKFFDIDITMSYHEAIDFMLKNGYMRGYQDGLFGTNDAISRAMLVTILWNMEGKPQVDYIMPFTDVTSDAYTEAIRWAASEGLVNGVTATLYEPYVNVSVEDMAVILMRYAEYKGYDTSVKDITDITSYEDYEDISEYAIPAMQYALGKGFITGDEKAYLTPGGEVARYKAAIIIKRFVESTQN